MSSLGDREDLRRTGANGATRCKQDGKDTWVRIRHRRQLQPDAQSTYLWADVERTEGATLDEDWRATIGVRHAF